MQRAITTYGLAIGGLTAAVIARTLLDPWLGDALPFVTLFGAVAYAAWIGGPRPAVLVTLLGYVAADFLFIAPRGHLDSADFPQAIGFVAYAFTCFDECVVFFESLFIEIQGLDCDRLKLLDHAVV